jgi:hypothetical protein
MRIPCLRLLRRLLAVEQRGEQPVERPAHGFVLQFLGFLPHLEVDVEPLGKPDMGEAPVQASTLRMAALRPSSPTTTYTSALAV